MKLNKRKLILFIIICVALITAGIFYYNWQENKSEVVFFDVGQGDAILINLPGNNEILIDGGPDNSVLYKLGEYLPIYNHDIELMILTHPHSDHVFGLVDILKRYKVEKVLLTQVKYDSEIYQEFLDLISQQKIEILNPGLLKEIKLTQTDLLKIIYPWENFKNKEFENQNDNSIVVKLDTPDKDFLLMGDIEENIEEEILNYVDQEVLQTEILKVGHHGSKTSSGENFISAVNPKVGIVSCGKDNKFGHPSLRTIRRLERLGVEIFRTDEDGDVIIEIRN